MNWRNSVVVSIFRTLLGTFLVFELGLHLDLLLGSTHPHYGADLAWIISGGLAAIGLIWHTTKVRKADAFCSILLCLLPMFVGMQSYWVRTQVHALSEGYLVGLTLYWVMRAIMVRHGYMEAGQQVERILKGS